MFVLLCPSCKTRPEKGSYTSPPGYDLNAPVRIVLPLELDEISGISFYEKDTSVFAITDETGILYKIKPNISITRWKFSNGGDYEDVVQTDTTFFVLKSNGDIYKVNYVMNAANTQVYDFPLKKNEFESLFYDSASKKLVMICKDCEADKKKSLTTYSFDPVTGQFSDSSFSIHVKEIAAAVEEDKIKFKPSAATINPITGELYIISSVNKLLVITDKEGQPRGAYPLNPAFFKQPEGMTFTKKGDLIISNEYAGRGTADLLIFKYKPTR